MQSVTTSLGSDRRMRTAHALAIVLAVKEAEPAPLAIVRPKQDDPAVAEVARLTDPAHLAGLRAVEAAGGRLPKTAIARNFRRSAGFKLCL